MPQYINGNAKEVEGKYGKFTNCSIKLEELSKIVNEKGYCNFTLSPRKEVGKYGETHSITVNEFKKEESVVNNENTTEKLKTGSYGKQKEQEDFDLDSIPF